MEIWKNIRKMQIRLVKFAFFPISYSRLVEFWEKLKLEVILII